MIIKLIDAKAKATGAERYARNLSAYMADGDPRRLRLDSAGLDYGLILSAYMTTKQDQDAEPRERVLCKAAMIDGSPVAWNDGVVEMEHRLALRSRRVKKPIRHVVLSYRDGEQPTERDCEQAVAVLADELGCGPSTILWAAHADTGNIHIHALFVMIEAARGGALSFGQGADGRANYKEAMQRAIARIEHAQSLQSEVGARYEVLGEHVIRKSTSPRPEARRSPFRQEILDFEERTGFASFTRIAQDRAAPLLERASTWDEAHRELARIGIGIRRAGNGGELFAGKDHVKLSNVDRGLSWKKLVKVDRLGPFSEPPEHLAIATFEPVVLDADKASAWLARQETRHAINRALNERVGSLLKRRDAAIDRVKGEIAARRHDLSTLEAEPIALRDLDAAWPRLQARAIEGLKAEFARRIEALRGLRHAADAEPDLEEIDLDALSTLDCGLVSPWHHRNMEPQPEAIPGFEAVPHGSVVQYWRNHANKIDDAPAFVDSGPIIWINDRSDDGLAAALTLAKERFGGAAIFGDQDYLDRCSRIAAQLGIEFEIITCEEALRPSRSRQTGRLNARKLAVHRAREGHGEHPARNAPIGSVDRQPGRLADDGEDSHRAERTHGGQPVQAANASVEHPSITAWRLARRRRAPEYECQHLAAQAVAQANVDPAIGDADSTLIRLIYDAQAYARRARGQRGLGRSRT